MKDIVQKFILFFTLLLISCAQNVSDKERATYSQQMRSEWDQCELEYTTHKDYIRYTYCENAATEKYFINVKFPYPEVVHVSNAYRMALAQRVINGELTHEQAVYIQLQFMRALVAQASEEQKRRAEDRAFWRSLVNTMNSNYLVNNPITCFQTGSAINCN